MDCYQGTLKLSKGALNSGVKRFVGVGTCFEYDLTYGILTINTPLKPLTPYAVAKVAVYQDLSKLFIKRNIEFVWCRLFYLFGEFEDKRRLVPYIRSQLKYGRTVELTTGNQVRDFMDVRQAGKMIVDIAKSETQGAVNVCSEIPITVRQFAEKIADEFGRRDLLNFGARPDNEIDPPIIVGKR